MYTMTLVTTRPDTSVEFYWNYLEIWPVNSNLYISKFNSSERLITVVKSVSEDNLTLTRVVFFKDQASAVSYFAGIDVEYPTWINEKNEYNNLHGHSETKTYSST